MPGRECKSCVDHSSLLWAHEADSCLKLALEELYQDFMEDNQLSDPSVCLRWEQRAVEKMNECYSTAWREYSVSDEDARTLTKLFHVDNYYANAVDQGIPSLVSQVNSALASQLLTNSSYDRKLFCVRGSSSKGQDLSQDEVLFTVEESLRDQSLPGAKFQYGGVDDNFEGGPCKGSQPTGINSNMFDFHLVSLLLPLNTSFTEPTFISSFFRPPSGNLISASGFELSSRIDDPELVVSYTQCGDAKRQSSEECDYGMGVEGCSINCKIMNGYDCSVDRFAPSVCWPEVCGDGRRTRGEECDDGNEVDGDGCDLTCSVEQGHSCTSSYNMTSTCEVKKEKIPVQFSPRHSPSYITARRLTAPSKVLVETHPSKRTLQLPLESSSKGSLHSSSVTVCILLAVLAALTNLNLWR